MIFMILIFSLRANEEILSFLISGSSSLFKRKFANCSFPIAYLILQVPSEKFSDTEYPSFFNLWDTVSSFSSRFSLSIFFISSSTFLSFQFPTLFLRLHPSSFVFLGKEYLLLFLQMLQKITKKAPDFSQGDEFVFKKYIDNSILLLYYFINKINFVIELKRKKIWQIM